LALRAFPGIPHVPMAVVPLFAAIGAGVAGLGLIGLTEWLVARMRERRDWQLSADALFDPLAAAALVSFAVGFVLFANPPATVATLRTLAASASGALAFVFLTASLGAVASRRRS
jgi:predicted permease